jgi:hypothetical protein
MRAILAVAAVFGLALAGAGLRPGAETPAAEAAIFVMNVTAVGQQENPPVLNQAGYATGQFTFNDQTRVMTFSVQVHNMAPSLVTAAHIHRGAVGVNGPIIHNLSLVPFSVVSGTITLSPEDVADLQAGRLYLNVHSVAVPSGFARAQLILPAGATSPAPAPTTAPAAPAPAITPPSTGDAGLATASGSALLVLAGFVLAAGAGTLALCRRSA